jgi:hypothetical protein
MRTLVYIYGLFFVASIMEVAFINGLILLAT